MDTIVAYEEARKIRDAQDIYCTKAEAGLWDSLASEVPKDLQWEALVDVLRGKVKSTSTLTLLVTLMVLRGHCAKLSNEFEFHISAIHHAHSAYLVTPLLEKFYGSKPAVAMFATNARYQQEAYRGSEFAPKILNDAGFDVIMKSDHPVLNSRYLLYEAAQAHLYGLPANKAIQSVTTIPAATAGFGHRLGYVKPGYDADIVLWDSRKPCTQTMTDDHVVCLTASTLDPLALGATPQQVFIDGIPQISRPVKGHKPAEPHDLPKTPRWEKETNDAIEYRGLPPLKGREPRKVGFVNIACLWERQNSAESLMKVVSEKKDGVMVFVEGEPACSSLHNDANCESNLSDNYEVIDLKGGCLAPGLTSFGSGLGLSEIQLEPSTNDGPAYRPFDKEFTVVGNLDQAADGLSFEGRNTLLAYRSGVTDSITVPQSGTMIAGLSVAFSNSGAHPLEDGAIFKNVTALHIQISTGGQPGVSTQIGLLCQILLSSDDSTITKWFHEVTQGTLPLIVHVNNADVIARLLKLKSDVEKMTGTPIRMAFFGGLESYLLAAEIAAAHVGVIVAPSAMGSFLYIKPLADETLGRSRAFPATEDSQRIIPGPPLSDHTVITRLLEYNVTGRLESGKDGKLVTQDLICYGLNERAGVILLKAKR
ncbi:hypothetical protein FRB96_005040 [Tulasnella sp. 330]|nr:hypothetical protein FRB96_005040 [Tulasnella sp. 330]